MTRKEERQGTLSVVRREAKAGSIVHHLGSQREHVPLSCGPHRIVSTTVAKLHRASGGTMGTRLWVPSLKSDGAKALSGQT